jgi:ornithine cyclodeaminase
VRDISKVKIWSRTPAHAEQLAASSPIDAETATDVAGAVDEADIICTTTASPDPILNGSSLRPGTHINAVGSSVPFARELDGTAMAMSRIFVDRTESTLNESGDFLIAREEGAVSDDDIVAELGEVLIGENPGRRSDDEITLFVSLGLAVEDIAAANVIFRNAVARGVGHRTEFGGRRHG